MSSVLCCDFRWLDDAVACFCEETTLSRVREWSNARLVAAGSGPRLQNPARGIRGGADQRDPLLEIARGATVAAEYAERHLRKSNLHAEFKPRQWSSSASKWAAGSE